MRQTLANGTGKFCRKKLSAWWKCTHQPGLAGSSWHDHQTLPICQAIFTVGCAGRMSLCSHMDTMRSGGISKAVVTLPVISACVWKHLNDACWISAEILCVKMNWSGRWRKSRRVPLWCLIVSIRLRRTWFIDEDGVVDPQLPVLTIVSCLVDALRMGGSYELAEKLWAQFVLTAVPVNTEVVWTRDEVFVGSVNFRNHFVSFPIYIVVLLLVNHRDSNDAPISLTRGWLG